MLLFTGRSFGANAALLSCSCPSFRSVDRFLLPLGLPDRLATRYRHDRPWRRQRMHVSCPDRLHFTFDCLQFSQAVRSFGASPLPEGAESVSISKLSATTILKKKKNSRCRGRSCRKPEREKSTLLNSQTCTILHSDYIYT